MNTLSPHAQKSNYTVYALIDPRDNRAFYVGMTNNVFRRYIEHLRGDDGNALKDERMKEFEELQIVPVMHSLEQIQDVTHAKEREQYWIQHYLMLRHPLTNAHAQREETYRTSTGKMSRYDGSPTIGRRFNASQIDEILDWYLLTGELPDDVSERQRYAYRHHPRLEERQKLLQLEGKFV